MPFIAAHPHPHDLGQLLGPIEHIMGAYDGDEIVPHLTPELLHTADKIVPGHRDLHQGRLLELLAKQLCRDPAGDHHVIGADHVGIELIPRRDNLFQHVLLCDGLKIVLELVVLSKGVKSSLKKTFLWK